MSNLEGNPIKITVTQIVNYKQDNVPLIVTYLEEPNIDLAKHIATVYAENLGGKNPKERLLIEISYNIVYFD